VLVQAGPTSKRAISVSPSAGVAVRELETAGIQRSSA
jgi:hypothetical protein